ncbi:MFS transporter [Nocardioides sp. GY 10113]|uniref:MFS transporter n=1 Tax=Nocardioides sp. GY 10113 TaxID=2569761 RepID=UPI0010A7BCAB|nr:MFS transporter [Nocardioides sp. GY 10113]TIC84802.1 MFS transporter [Nocardioides sp. GY 10113]
MSATGATGAAAPEDSGIIGSTETGRRPGVGVLSTYAAGSLGMGVWVTVPGLLLLYFLTDTLGVPAFLAGLTLLLPKIVDVVVHPVLGSRSDAEARRVGHRRRMMRGGVLLGAAMVAMFTVPTGLTGGAAAVWVGGWFIVGNLLFATFQVPYLTTPSDLRVGYHERTRVFMFRMLFLTLGLLGAGIAAPALVEGEQRSDYARMAAVLCVVMVASAAIALIGVRRLTDVAGFRAPEAGATHSTRADLALAWADRDFRALVLSYLFTGTTTHLFLAGVPYYADYVFDDTGLTALFMGAFLGPAVLAGPAWMVISRRIGKQRGLLICQAAFIAGSLALLAGATLGVAATALVVVVLGSAFAGLQLLAFSMVPDAVAAGQARGHSRAGAYTGVWTATEATGTALGPYVYAAALAVGGFVSSTADEHVAQSDSALRALVWGFTLLPAALMAIAMVFQRRCRLDEGAASRD